jgi:hypothetical protein
MRTPLPWIAGGLAALLLSSCEGYFGTRTDLDFIDIPDYTIREIAYVPIQPEWKGFVRPVDVCVGFDELLYVVDEGTEEIVALDEAGRELGRLRVPGVHAVRQDRRFDLLALGTHDTAINGVSYDLACLYRIRMIQGTNYGLSYGQVVHKTVHPFYFKNTFSLGDAQVRFESIGVLGSNQPAKNNRYYVTRTGPSPNNANQGPDDAVLQFSANDEWLTSVSVNTSSGLFNNYFKKPFGLVTYCQPPQITANAGDDFLVTSLSPSQAIQIQGVTFEETDFGAEFRPNTFQPDPSLADNYLQKPQRFSKPTGLCMAGDNTRYIWVVDAEKDSVYQFTSNGLEGVPPPPASGERRYAVTSFGGRGSGVGQFNEPRAAAYYKKILYIADAGNGRIVRYKLTLDFD